MSEEISGAVETAEARILRRSASSRGDDADAGAAGGPLERQKFQLLQAISRDKKAVGELEARIAAAESELLARKQALGQANALFMTLPDAAARAPRQRLGANNAVLETKRIIAREVDKAKKEAAVVEMKLNKAREKNAGVRAAINATRKDAMTFRKLFAAMTDDLNGLKARIAECKAAIAEGYAERDRAQEEMRELVKRFEVDKLERQQEWQVFTDAIERANAEGAPEAAEVASGLLTQAEEDELRKKIRRGQAKMARDRTALAAATEKLAAFRAAIGRIREATGYDNLQDVIDLFDRYEEEKFSKIGAASRLVSEIEWLERDIAATRTTSATRDAADSRLSSERASLVASLRGQAEATEGAVTAEAGAIRESLAELKSLSRVIEFAFRAVGADEAVDPHLHAVEAAELQAGGAAAAAPSATAAAAGTGDPSAGGATASAADAGGFHVPALGCVSSVGAPAAAAAPGGGGPAASPGASAAAAAATPARSRAGSLAMFTSTAGTAQDVATGVLVGTLGRFVGILETRAVDVMQAYAAACAAASDAASAAAARAAAEEAALATSMLSSPNASQQLPPGDAAAAAAGGAGAEAARRLGAAAAAAAAAIGPTRPTGRLRESFAASTLVTSLIDASRVAAAGAGAAAAAATTTTARPDGGDGTPTAGGGGLARGKSPSTSKSSRSSDGGVAAAAAAAQGAASAAAAADARPVPLDQAKRQVADSLAMDRTVQAVRAAAAAAATVLARAPQ